MLIIDHIGVFMNKAILPSEVSVIAWQVLMGVPDRFIVMSWTPDRNADQQRTTRHDSKPDERRSQTDVRPQPSRQWIGDQPTSMG